VFVVVNVRDWSRAALVASEAAQAAWGRAVSMYISEQFASLNMTWRFQLVVGALDLEFPANTRLAGDTSKALDKNVVVRVILHAQCSLQRKEAR